MIKERLRAFGEQIKNIKPEVRYTAAFWRKRLSELKDSCTWDYVITLYLAHWCTDEERQFIDSIFFCGNTVLWASAQLHLSERESYYWLDTIYKDLIALAVESGIVTLNLLYDAGVREEIASCDDYEIAENIWIAIEKIVIKNIKHKPKHLRADIEAMLIISDMGLTWRELPKKYGSWKTIYNKYNQWRKSGLWRQIRNIIQYADNATGNNG